MSCDSCEQGGRLSTQYLWNFNDTSVAVNVTGYEAGHEQIHTFTAPGIYNVTIVASSNEGSSFLTLPVSVLGRGEGGGESPHVTGICSLFVQILCLM